MSEQKIRRKTFLAALGASAVAALGTFTGRQSSNRNERAMTATVSERVVREPRAVSRPDEIV